MTCKLRYSAMRRHFVAPASASHHCKKASWPPPHCGDARWRGLWRLCGCGASTEIGMTVLDGTMRDFMSNGVTAPLARHAMAYVLAGGRGSRLMELTDRRAKPAVYFGGKSRIIDFALSNALNSGIRRIAVATQYKAHSLIRHLQRGWNFLRPERNESFDILPASQRVSEEHLVSRHRRRGLSEHRHHRRLRSEIHRRAGGRPRLQDGLRDDAAAACRAEAPT